MVMRAFVAGVLLVVGSGVCFLSGCSSSRAAVDGAEHASRHAVEVDEFAPVSHLQRVQHRYHFTRLIMGVEAKITIESERTEAEVSDAACASFFRLGELDMMLSDYKRESELNRLTRRGANVPVKVSEDLYRVLAAARRVSEATDGAFDVTVGPYVALWRRARDSGRLPTREELDEAKGRVGYELIELDEAAGTVTLRAENMKLDLGGIAKGYAAAEGREKLKELGFPRCLVGLAGDIAAGDAPVEGESGEAELVGWRVDVEASGVDRQARSLRLQNRCVSTSGDAVQFVVIDGVRYGHIVEARTGLGATRVSQVTVVGGDGAEADAVATGFSLMSEAERELAKQRIEGCDVF